jgi:putative selenium metabolism protein SsnA
MRYRLKDATVVTLDPVAIERTSLRIGDGRIIERGDSLVPLDGEEALDLGGKIVMPGLVCGHTHLYSALSRGMPPPSIPPESFTGILKLIWWRMDRALDEESIYYSALAGALDAARAGTTCLFDHHSSPGQITGSLNLVRKAIETVGLRAVLCYEITDRGGSLLRDEGLQESRAFLESVKGRLQSQNEAGASLVRGMVGAHASFTLSAESIEACAELMHRYDSGLHIHAGEDSCDVEDARAKYNMGPVARLARHGALNRRTILAHGTHLDESDIRIARDVGAWFAHNPRSNMNNQVGYAPVGRFGKRVVLGTDGIGADMFEESRFAFFKARDAHSGLGAAECLSWLANNQRMASDAFGIELGNLIPGSAADLIVLDYDPPTPVTAANLAWHFVFGMQSASVRSLMVNGKFVIRDGKSALDEAEIHANARRASQKLWGKFRAIRD